MLQEFKKFAMKGNVIDLAVGLVIGAAFGKIVTSFVDDVLMPPIGLLMGKVDIASLFVSLDGNTYESLEAAKEAGGLTLNYGNFINIIIQFIIIAFSVFLVVKAVNKMNEKEEATPDPTTKECPHCFKEIPIKATRCPECTSELG